MGDKFILSGPGRTTEVVAPTENPTDRLESWKREVAESYRQMLRFIDMDPTDVFLHLSQFSARASEIRSQIGPFEGKRESQFRIRIIDPFIEECERQFKIHSRLQAIREMDARLAGGQFA